jgi:hypothetical protein
MTTEEDISSIIVLEVAYLSQGEDVKITTLMRARQTQEAAAICMVAQASHTEVKAMEVKWEELMLFTRVTTDKQEFMLIVDSHTLATIQADMVKKTFECPREVVQTIAANSTT